MTKFDIKKAIQQTYDSLEKSEKAGRKTGWFSLKHVNAYDKHFEDYTEELQADDKGHIHVKREYAGDYYVPKMSNASYNVTKVLFVMLWAICGCSFIFASLKYMADDSAIYIIIGQAGVMIALIWMIMGLYNYVVSPFRKTIGDYKAGPDRVENSSILGFIAYGYTTGASIVNIVIAGAATSDKILSVVGYACGFASSLAVYVIGKIIKYEKISGIIQNVAML